MPTKFTLLLYFVLLSLFTSYCIANIGMADRKAQFEECVLASDQTNIAICECASITELYELCPDAVTSVEFPEEIGEVQEGDTLVYRIEHKRAVFEYYNFKRKLKRNEHLVTFTL